jgi:hypothetical protein
MSVFFNDLIQITGLTAGSWRTKDLSGAPWNVPTSAIGLVIVAYNSYNMASFALRSYGSTDNRINSINVYRKYGCYVGCTNSVFEYYIGSTSVQLFLAGYFEEDAYFFQNAIVQTGNGVVTVPSEVPSSAKAIIVELRGSGTNSWVRSVGVSPYIQNDYNQFGIVGLNTSKQYEIFDPAGNTIYVRGYITQGVWLSSWPDISLTVTGSYRDIDLSPYGPTEFSTGALVCVYPTGTYRLYDIRPDGITTERYSNQYTEKCSYPVRLPANQIIEGKIQNLDADFYLIGFFGSYQPPPITKPTNEELMRHLRWFHDGKDQGCYLGSR